VRLGFSRTNADSQWNPVTVYIAFHQKNCCRNETIRRWYCKRDLDAANLQPALEEDCGRQAPSAGILFFHTNLPCVCLVSKFRGESNLGRCTTSVLANTMPPRIGKKIADKHVLKAEVATPHWHSFASTKIVHRSRLDSSLHFDIRNI